MLVPGLNFTYRIFKIYLQLSILFCPGLTAFLAHFVLVFGANDLVKVMDQVQDRIFSRVLEKVIIPHAELAISSPVGLMNPTFVLTGKFQQVKVFLQVD